MTQRAAVADLTPVDPKDPILALIDEGNALEEQGRVTEAMARYDAAVQADPQCARAHLNRGNVLLASGQIDQARSAYEAAIACDPRYAGAHFNLGNLNSRAGEYERALQNYQTAVEIKPDFANAFVAMGNALDGLGRISEAIASYERALALNPADAGVHFNLGLLAMKQARHEQAADSLRAATDLQPEYAAAHQALGRLFNGLGRLDAAESSWRRALSLEPESDEILYNLTMVLNARGKAPEAIELNLQQLERAPTWRTKMGFASSVSRVEFSAGTSDGAVRAALTVAIAEPWGVPYQLCRPALSLIMLNPQIAAMVRMVNESWPTRLPKSTLFDGDALGTLAADALLHAVLEAVPVSKIEFERLLTATRHALIESASSEQPPEPSDIAALPFYAALARQCFINEYVFDCDEREQAAAAVCRARLAQLLDANAPVPPLLLLAVACYFPLYTLPEPGRLLVPSQEGPVERVLRQQVREPLEEQALRAGVPSLTPISAGVSEKVREQYEENPYPRWVKLPNNFPSFHLNGELRRTFPLAPFTPLPDDRHPDMLIAGCGTGSQPILALQRFRGIRVLAVDLSLSSIGYAMRKTREFAFPNIEFAQADILRLGDIARTFDVVASTGVLHHLADPFLGWRILLSLLAPGGFMQLGFYSQIARRYVTRTREFIAARGYGTTADDIRRVRRELFGRDTAGELKWLTNSPDFFSTSECRDLIFHVQEHCLTLEQIESFLSEAELDFLGFELDPQKLQWYRNRFPEDPAATNLRNWARYEVDNPDTFIGMYQFWVQKRVKH